LEGKMSIFLLSAIVAIVIAILGAIFGFRGLVGCIFLPLRILFFIFIVVAAIMIILYFTVGHNVRIF
jgi:hypothetical protein